MNAANACDQTESKSEDSQMKLLTEDIQADIGNRLDKIEFESIDEMSESNALPSTEFTEQCEKSDTDENLKCQMTGTDASVATTPSKVQHETPSQNQIQTPSGRKYNTTSKIPIRNDGSSLKIPTPTHTPVFVRPKNVPANKKAKKLYFT